MQDMNVMPDVRIEDMGHKMGCNGVDNGKLWFDGACPGCNLQATPVMQLHDHAKSAAVTVKI